MSTITLEARLSKGLPLRHAVHVGNKIAYSRTRPAILGTFWEQSLKNKDIVKEIAGDAVHNLFRVMSERLNTSEIKEISNNTGLKIRLFLVGYSCDKCPQYKQETENFFSNLPSIDFYKDAYHQVLYQLKNSKFIGYASVVIIVHRISLLLDIMAAMEHNPYLRYKSKFILCRHEQYLVDSFNLPQRRKSNRWQMQLQSAKEILFEMEEFIEGSSAICINLKNQHNTRNSYNQKSRQLDNALLLHWLETDKFSARYGYALVLYVILRQPYTALKLTLKEAFRHLVATPNADLYCYSINPALAIIINNYYFSNRCEIREGSDVDVVHLIRELKIARIPYILIEDCNQEELMQIFNFIENKDFRPLKSFLLFLMSHGDANDIIYTRDGQLSIKQDIIRRMQANRSLESVEKLLAIIACRGEIDMEFADLEDLVNILPSDSKHLKANTTLMYSVPNNVQSIRSPISGCPYVESFCQHFRHMGHTDDLLLLNEKINKDLKECAYFQGLEKCCELVVRDGHKPHRIVQMPVQVLEMLQLLKSISEEFPLQESLERFADFGNTMPSSYVCSILNMTKFQKDRTARKYFAKELEWDTFSVTTE